MSRPAGTGAESGCRLGARILSDAAEYPFEQGPDTGESRRYRS